MADTPYIPLGITLVGAYLSWFGVHYWESDVKWPSDPVKAVLTGKPLPENTISKPPGYGFTAVGSAGAEIGSAATAIVGSLEQGKKIAQDALQYKGAGYVWGGNADKVGNWDCSSFVSYVLGHDLGITLPGGKWGSVGYPPRYHGPTTLDYMLFGSSVDLKDVQAGDLIVSVEHIGIAISPTQMISAESPQSGTGVAGFPGGFPSGPPIYRRVPSA